MPDCHMPFHWPRLDKDLLLCVRIINVPKCVWSGGIRLDDNYSLTINVRDAIGKMYFLRVDVVLQEITYFIVFTDANTMPPPIRVDNFSEVALTVNQVYNIFLYYVLNIFYSYVFCKLYTIFILIFILHIYYFYLLLYKFINNLILIDCFFFVLQLIYIHRLKCPIICNGLLDHTRQYHTLWMNQYRLLV